MSVLLTRYENKQHLTEYTTNKQQKKRYFCRRQKNSPATNRDSAAKIAAGLTSLYLLHNQAGKGRRFRRQLAVEVRFDLADRSEKSSSKILRRGLEDPAGGSG
ncbi:predicted protein [Coccidioides posadasii str. Silveira]|uniref:Predicted protein n=3 Tax=Coccidioides posadasii TaxID=199306 RepID=E9DFU5_COCPS|nr:predicted protein [Coccidioides posadasii str. Silveira]KMM63733.1 hypothetical protein CPAG_00087 [Coccidioides posadasii RMSCC 3488]